MPSTLTLTSWNINSVRLREAQVLRFLKESRPDILALQEIKCRTEEFPGKDFAALGYVHQAVHGQKGYHGVAILSRLPFAEIRSEVFGGRPDARHVAVRLGEGAGAAKGLVVHDFYVPAGGDVPDASLNDKFAHKLLYLDELRPWTDRVRAPGEAPAVLLGDLNIAPSEFDVWSHRQLLDVVSHTPLETTTLDALRDQGGWIDAVRAKNPEPEKLFSWWSYRNNDWTASDRGRRLDHAWLTPDLAPALKSVAIERRTRSWERPSDHVPVTVTLEL